MSAYRISLLASLFCFGAFAQNSFWANTAVPQTAEATNDSSSVTLGLRFTSDVAGTVTAVRFYKGYRNTGTHTGQIWSSNGTKLAEVTFANETTSGWQQARFSTPVSIAANTTYTVSYTAPRGNYACDQYFSWSNVNATPLRVSGTSPGVFVYGSSARFPNSSWNRSNYWVDVVFVPSTGSPSTYSISGRVTGSPATLTLSGTAGATTTTNSTGTYTFSNLRNGTYVVAPSRSGYSFSPSTAAVTINGASVSGVNFTATAQPVSRSVSLSWTASTSPNVSGYNVYRATTAGGTYVRINGSTVTGTSFVDRNVVAGQTYYYVATALNGTSESGFSTSVSARIPL
jgi:hypothetical protein